MSDLSLTFGGHALFKSIDVRLTRAGKEIVTINVEIPGQYTQVVPLRVFGALAERARAGAWEVGTVLRVSGRLGGREWQGKIYGDVTATQIDVAFAAPAKPAAASGADDKMPF